MLVLAVDLSFSFGLVVIIFRSFGSLYANLCVAKLVAEKNFCRYLSFNNFKGEIPRELASLPELRYLHLQENRFIGRIPPELGTLQHLRHL